MAPLSGVASYKKKDGILILSNDEKTLTWVAAAGPQMVIPVSTITSTCRIASVMPQCLLGK